jgi:hypothetical protein
VAAAGLFMGTVASGGDVLELAVMPGESRLKVMLSPDTPALVEETRELFLAAGMNRVRFDWAQEKIDGGSLRLRFSPAGGSEASIVSTVIPQGIPRTLYFDVRSGTEGPAAVALTYLLSGIGWKVEYSGLRNNTEDRIDLRRSADLNNQSGLDLEGTEVDLGIGRIDALDLRHNAGCRLEMMRSKGVPVEKSYTYDATKNGGKVAIHIKLINDEGSGLGKMALPSGKIRLFKEPLPGEGAARIGEDLFPATPVGEKTEIYMGNAEEITVERKVLKSVRENERRDRWNQVVLYDQRDRLWFKITNHREKEVPLKMVEHLSGAWEMVEKGKDFERKDAGTVEYLVPIAGGGNVTFEVEYIRRDLW